MRNVSNAAGVWMRWTRSVLLRSCTRTGGTNVGRRVDEVVYLSDTEDESLQQFSGGGAHQQLLSRMRTNNATYDVELGGGGSGEEYGYGYCGLAMDTSMGMIMRLEHARLCKVERPQRWQDMQQQCGPRRWCSRQYDLWQPVVGHNAHIPGMRAAEGHAVMMTQAEGALMMLHMALVVVNVALADEVVGMVEHVLVFISPSVFAALPI